ncbi:unnamed protein product [Effrenium voratum]|uniref:Uncharacterized protein n=1 Tax=Effrenium voratum TaxID=2562239 RepID=A0AA36HRQ8_9DINO|nr:unnamed protein product [Effrenium voratum]
MSGCQMAPTLTACALQILFFIAKSVLSCACSELYKQAPEQNAVAAGAIAVLVIMPELRFSDKFDEFADCLCNLHVHNLRSPKDCPPNVCSLQQKCQQSVKINVSERMSERERERERERGRCVSVCVSLCLCVCVCVCLFCCACVCFCMPQWDSLHMCLSLCPPQKKKRIRRTFRQFRAGLVAFGAWSLWRMTREKPQKERSSKSWRNEMKTARMEKKRR